MNEVFPAMNDRRIVERDLPIRTYDIDFAGIVGNIVYVRWLEDLRLAMMEEAYPIARARRGCGADPAGDAHRL